MKLYQTPEFVLEHSNKDLSASLDIYLQLFLQLLGNPLHYVQDFQRQAVGDEGLNNRKRMEYLFL
mgnify:FL=1